MEGDVWKNCFGPGARFKRPLPFTPESKITLVDGEGGTFTKRLGDLDKAEMFQFLKAEEAKLVQFAQENVGITNLDALVEERVGSQNYRDAVDILENLGEVESDQEREVKDAQTQDEIVENRADSIDLPDIDRSINTYAQIPLRTVENASLDRRLDRDNPAYDAVATIIADVGNGDGSTIQAVLEALQGTALRETHKKYFHRVFSEVIPWDRPDEVLENLDQLADSISAITPVRQETKARSEVFDDDDLDDDLEISTVDSNAFGNYDNADSLYYNEGGRAVPLAPGAVRAAVRSVYKQLKAKLPTQVYSSRGDLAAKDPDTWRSMVGNNPRLESGDSIAAAYHNGKVFIFSDAIFSPNHLRFVLGHEVLGHHGLRALIGKDKLAPVLLGLYEESQSGWRVGTWLADGVDAMRNRDPKIGKLEAIEEVLADKASAMASDVYPLYRIFKAIERAIKRIFGLDTPEDLALYTLHQARKYLRTGTVTSGFSLDAIAKDVSDLGDRSGQFERVMLHENPSLAVAQQAMFEKEEIGAFTGENAKGLWESLKSKSDDFVHDFYRLMVFSARENPGFAEMNKLFDNARKVASRIRQGSNEKTSRFFFKTSGPVDIELNKMLFFGDALRTAETRTKDGEDKSLVDIMGQGARTPLFDYASSSMRLRPPALDDARIDTFFQKGLLSLEEFRKGITVDGYTYTPNKALSEADYKNAYDAYVAFREAFRTTEEELVRAKYGNVLDSIRLGWEDLVFAAQRSKGLASTLDTARNRAIFESIHRVAIDQIVNSSVQIKGGTITNATETLQKANQFSIAVNTYLRATDSRSNDAGVEERRQAIRDALPKEAQAEDFLNDLETLRASMGYQYSQIGERSDRLIQQSVQRATQEHFSALRDDYQMKWSLIRGYAPITREGDFQVKVEAYDPATGNSVSVPQDFQSQLLFSLFKDSPFALDPGGNRAKAISLAKDLNKLFKGEDGIPRQYDLAPEVSEKSRAMDEARPEGERRGTPERVSLRAVYGPAAQGVQAPPNVDPAAFLRAINSFGVNLKPKDLNPIIEAVTRQDAGLRNKLYREGRPGFPYQAKKGLAKHMEQRASVAGKASVSAALTHLFSRSTSAYSDNLWSGDGARLARLRAEIADMPPGGARDSLQRELDLVQFRYDKTNPSGLESRKNTYLNRAYKALQFYDGESDVEFSQFDLKGSVATVRTLTSVAYLGGSFASGMLNILTLFSNTLPYLSTYNNKRAFGGGFGLAKTWAELASAMGTMGSRKFVDPKVITRSGKPEDDPNNAAFYEAIAAKFKDGDAKLLAGGKIDYYQKKDGLTRDEANFLAQEIREGKMIPAISNMVMYSARGMPEFLSRGAKYIDTYMSFFNQTEQYARRAAGLAAYRLHRDRAFAEAKIDPNKPESAAALAEIQENARNFAAESLDVTVGEYSTMNRPPMFRGSLLGLTYTFKAFPTTMTLLMRNLPKSGQAAMILALWTAGGLTALPFAEDLEDIADTLGQRLGIYKAFGIGGSGRKALEELAAKELGLFGKILTRGGFRYIPVVGGSADIGSRLSLGNQIPLTTVALQGSTSLERDLIDALGPVVTFSIDSVKSATALTAESFRFVNGEPTEFNRVLRESPVTAMRYASDIYTYQATDAITDKKGAVISREGLTGAMFARALGFYPQVAADENTFIKMAQRDRQFHRHMSSGMRDRWIRATLQGNTDDAATIEAWVNEWNAQNPDRAINNFKRNAQRGLKEWRKLSRDRFIASSPVALRRSFEEFSELYDDE